MNITANEKQELMIASVTPQNLERGVSWFQENAESIKRVIRTNAWWSRHALILEVGQTMKPSECARRLAEFGYERAPFVRGRGIAAVRGGVLEVWPVNEAHPVRIEFIGNSIASLASRESAEEVAGPGSTLRQSIAELPEGSFVVHTDHGIGIFRGVQSDTNTRMHPNDTNNSNSAFESFACHSSHSCRYYVVEYAPPASGREPDRLFVPITQKDRLTPYTGFETPTVHRLGGSVWITTKRKAREQAEKFAQKLLALYAERSGARRDPYPGEDEVIDILKSSFAYQETPDQTRAEQEIRADFERDTPMDRVLCGDVGFGKTEVAVRTAGRAIAAGKQVAVLAPTTLLAAQHSDTFARRFADLPFSVTMLSRLSPPADQKRILADAAEGKIDCLIGTHRLLSRDVQFKNLGLVIIDEEQRFGVKQKEHFQSLRSSVDVLSLSATPIPRTLQFTLAKLRDISTIHTPPPERLPIRTFVLPHSWRTVAHALRQELERGGQAYVLHNRIETLGWIKKRMERATRSFGKKPRIESIHGRMRDQELVRIMEQFRAKEIDVLIATTIIENGLDIASANTLIVDDATRLGLAQAHQLRGRIGRGREQAYAYFLYAPQRLTDKAAERLEALRAFAELGAGYDIALRDLEIRGAGNILGREQSGAINKVGLNLYYQMLAEAVEELDYAKK